MTESVGTWVRNNIVLAAAVLAVMGTILGAIVAGTLWLASVEHLEKRVDVIRIDVTALQNFMVKDHETVAAVRRGLDATDAATAVTVGRMEERLKALEKERDHR